MERTEKIVITVNSLINAPVEVVWKNWTNPADIVKWNNASEEWYTPSAENDLREGGKFNYRMEAKDGSMGFDFLGVYDKVNLHQHIEYTLGDGRKVKIIFSNVGNKTDLLESFEIEDVNSAELQKTGWQSILNNFKKYVETQKEYEEGKK